MRSVGLKLNVSFDDLRSVELQLDVSFKDLRSDNLELDVPFEDLRSVELELDVPFKGLRSDNFDLYKTNYPLVLFDHDLAMEHVHTTGPFIFTGLTRIDLNFFSFVLR